MIRICFIAFAVASAFAQNARIAGTVVDARGGEPLARVKVQLVGADRETVSDDKGRFAIDEVPPGEYTLNVSTVGFRMVKKPFALAAGEPKDFEVVLSPETLRQTDKVEVKSGPFEVARQDTPSQLTLDRSEAKNLASVLADDPLRAVQSMPGVAANDDFNSRFSIRGADYNHVGLLLDDVLMHAPFHTVQAESNTGSITIFNGDMLDDLALYSGAMPARYQNRTAGVLDVHTRDGNRDAVSFRGAASASNAGAIMEGPLGKHGSWMAGARKSYLQYIIRRTSSDTSIAFGFWDAQGRLAYDISPKSTLTLSVIEGVSDLDRSSVKNKLGINSMMQGQFHFTVTNLGWRYAPGEKLLVTTHAAYMRETFDDRNRDLLQLGSGIYGEFVGTTNATWAWFAKSPMDFGFTVRRVRDSGYSGTYQSNQTAIRLVDGYRGNSTLAGGYGQQLLTAAGGRMSLALGARWDHHSLTGAAATSPYASLTLSPLSGTKLQLGWGSYAQFAEIPDLLSRYGRRSLLPDRANHLVAALEQKIDDRTRIRIEAYQREDRDVLWRRAFEPRILQGRIFNPPVDAPIANALRGYARGAEIFLQRRSANRLTGWVSYALGYSRMRDNLAHLEFPSDFDQRHTVNVYGSYRMRPTVNLSAKWNYGSGFPIPGFLRLINGQYFLAEDRNGLRLSSYQRTDFRLNKAWPKDRWKITLYGEVVNLTNRANWRFDSFNGYNNRTGSASVQLDKMFPILPSVGVVFER